MGLLRGSRRPDQRGAVAVVVAVMLSLLLIAAAFAVDLNMQRVAARDAQAAADLIALDVARELNGTTNAEVGPALAAAFNASRQRNADGFGLDPDLFRLQTGTLRPDNGHFQHAPAAGDVPTAVRVITRGGVDRLFTTGTGAVERDAVATATGGGCFKLGSYAARINANDSFILGPLLDVLGTGAELSILDAQGLAAADVTLLDLVSVPALGVGTYQELLRAPITLGQFYLAMAEVLRAESGQTAQADLLGRLASLPLGAAQIALDEIVSVGTGGTSGLSAGLNVFDLVAGSAFAANGDSVVEIPGLSIGVPGVVVTETSVVVGQKPNQACGRPGAAGAVAESSQVDIDVTASLRPLNVSLLGLAGLQASGAVSVRVSAAPAEGRLERIGCQGESRTITVAVGDGLLDIEVSAELRLSAMVLGARVPVADLDLALGTERSSPESEVVVTVDDGDYSVRGSTGDDSLGVPGLTLRRSQVDVLGVLPVGGLVGAVTPPLLNILNPLIQDIDRAVLSPLLQSLGINVAGADVYPVPVPECDVPVLHQ